MGKSDAIDRNRHIREYLHYYVKLPQPPHYAVLINGPWGIGKTFVVRKILKEQFKDDPTGYTYVTLYGLTSTEEIDIALLEAHFPAWRLVKAAGRVTDSLLKKLGLDLNADIKPADILRKDKERLYVFDDLERCSMSIDQVLGYINGFVEHNDCRVVIVANEKEIKDPAYANKREKLIGKVLQVQPVTEEALDDFISKLKTKAARELLTSRKSEILAIYDQSGFNNLRILQQSLWDFERLVKVIDPSYLDLKDAITALLQLFLALSFEFKSGTIMEDDLSDRLDKIVAGGHEVEEAKNQNRLFVASQKYKDLYLHADYLPEPLLVDILARGSVDQGAVRTFMSASPHYVRPKGEPAWQVVWDGQNRDDEEFERACQSMEADFKACKFEETGEVLHVLGLRLWLSEIKVIPQSLRDVVEEGREYIDNLYSAGKLAKADEPPSELRMTGWYGLGITKKDTNEFKTLVDHFKGQRQKAIDGTYPKRAEKLLKEMKEDIDGFARQLDVPFANIPVLATLDARAFVTEVLALPPRSFQSVMKALKHRYSSGYLTTSLAPEQAWLKAVKDALVKATVTMSPIARYRVNNGITYCIDPYLKEEQANAIAQKNRHGQQGVGFRRLSNI
jgi:DNA polymerase III delta prime subunit